MIRRNYNVKRVFAGAMSAIMALPLSATIPPSEAYAEEQEIKLPISIVENKKSFDAIEGVVKKYEAMFPDRVPAASQYVTSVNGESRLKRINFYYPETPVEVNGEITIDIPEDVAKVMRMFGNVRYTGSIAKGGAGTMYVVDPDGTEHELPNYDIAWQGEYKNAAGESLWTSYGGTKDCDSKLMNPTVGLAEGQEPDYSGYKLKFTGTGDLSFVYLWEETGLATEYDTSAYGIMGGDKGIADVTIDLDTLSNLSINGKNKMDEDVFKRVHVNSGPVQVFSDLNSLILDDEVFSKTYRDWGFIPGRGAFQIKDANGLLTEDPNRPGYSTTDNLYDAYAQNDEVTNKLHTLFPSIGDDYVITFDGWPTWQWGELAEQNKKNINFASPSEEFFAAAGDTAAAVTKAMTNRLSGYGPKYIEVKNESTIPSEWAYFNTESKDVAWDKLATFHNTVADSIKAVNPNVLVGGPSSAFMYLEKDQFDEAYRQLKFMDATKDSLDYYSHHFYENSNLYVNGRANNSDGFLCGRFEAVVDLLKAHMVNTNNVKPILITEEGSYNGLTTDIDYFGVLTAFNGYLLRSIDYADTIDMLVPYLYPVKSWEPQANHQLYRYNSTQTAIEDTMTPIEAYVDLWKDFRGAFIPSFVRADDDLVEERVYAKATRNGDKVYVAVHNLNDQRINLDLNMLIGEGNTIQNVTEKHYYLEAGKLTYETIGVADINNILMRTQEMAVFEIDLVQTASFNQELYRHVDYAKEELVSTDAPANFTIHTNTDNLIKSVLRVGFGKSGSGFDGSMNIVVNGKYVAKKDLSYTNKSGDIFTVTEFDLNPSVLCDGINNVTISMPAGGKISSVALYNYYPRTVQGNVSVEPLVTKVNEALELIDAKLYVSADGSEVPNGSKWITQLYYDSFVNAIADASECLTDNMMSSSELTQELTTLDRAMAAFEKNQIVASTETSGLLQMNTISFEDGEEIPTVDINKAVSSYEVVSEHASEGSKALKYTVTTLNADLNSYWANKTIKFLCPDKEGWDLSNGFSFDVYNDTDVDEKFYILFRDKTGKDVWTWAFEVPAKTTKTIQQTNFSARPDWVDSCGLSEGIDAKHIVSIGLAAYESFQVEKGKTEAIFYIDNIKALPPVSNVVEFPETTFDGDEIPAYTCSTVNGATYDIIAANGEVISSVSGSSEAVSVSGGNGALKVTVPTMDATWGKLSMLKWNAPEGKVWNIESLSFDLTNNMDYDLPYVVNVKDETGALTQNWLSIPAKATQTVTLTPASPANYKKVVEVGIYINEPSPLMKDKTNVSYTIDKVRAAQGEESTAVTVTVPVVNTAIETSSSMKAEKELPCYDKPVLSDDSTPAPEVVTPTPSAPVESTVEITIKETAAGHIFVIFEKIPDVVVGTNKENKFYDASEKLIINALIKTNYNHLLMVDVKGEIVKGQIFKDRVTGKKYFANKKGWIYLNKAFNFAGKRYQADENGVILTSQVVKTNLGHLAYAGLDGSFVKNRIIRLENGKQIYANKFGVIVTNKLLVLRSGMKFKTDENGYMTRVK